jgi:HD superfamily phosphodiesterase
VKHRVTRRLAETPGNDRCISKMILCWGVVLKPKYEQVASRTARTLGEIKLYGGSMKAEKAYKLIDTKYSKVMDEYIATLKIDNIFDELRRKLDESNDKEMTDRIIKHSKYVAYLVNELYLEEYNFTEEDVKITNYAAALHDIMWLTDKSNHHIAGKKYIKTGDFIEKASIKLSKEDLNKIAVIIEYHKNGESEAKLEGELKTMCELIHDADKISKIFKEKNWIKNKEYKKSKIRTVMEKQYKKLKLRKSQIVCQKYIDEIETNFSL